MSKSINELVNIESVDEIPVISITENSYIFRCRGKSYLHLDKLRSPKVIWS